MVYFQLKFEHRERLHVADYCLSKTLVYQYACGAANQTSFLEFLNWASCFIGI